MSEEALSLDEAIDRIPMGYFHYRLLLLTGLAYCSDAMEVNLLSFLSACAGAEWDLKTSQQASISSVVFAGIIIGSFFWGWVADRFGRRFTYMCSCSTILVGGVLSGVAPSFGWLLVFRAIAGYGIAGMTIPFILLAEFLPKNQRGQFLIYIQIFWTIGAMYVSGLAWAILEGLGWRILAYLSALPIAVVTILSYFYLPESPRWLIENGRVSEAYQELESVGRVNGVQLGSFRLRSDDDASQSKPNSATTTSAIVTDIDTNNNQERLLDENNNNGSNNKCSSFYNLFSDSVQRKISVPLIIVWTFFGVAYYGTILFVSRIYSNQDSDDDSDEVCDFDYFSIFMNAFAELGSSIACILVVDRWGRVRSMTVFYCIGGIALVVMALQPMDALLAVAAAIARISIQAGSISTWVVTPELFTTELRAAGQSTSAAGSKIGAFLAPFIVISNVSIFGVGIILGVLIIIAALCSTVLPETKDHSMGMKGSADAIVLSNPSSHPFFNNNVETSAAENPGEDMEEDIEIDFSGNNSSNEDSTQATAVIDSTVSPIYNDPSRS